MMTDADSVEPNDTAFMIGRWRVDPAARRLTDGSRTVKIEQKMMATLVLLFARAGAVVSREVLIHDVWGEGSATDDLLSRVISGLRRALDDDPRNPRIIETVRGAGYRLTLPVDIAPPRDSVVETSHAPAPPPAPPPAPAPRPARGRVRAALVAGGVASGLAVLATLAFSRTERTQVPAASTALVRPATTLPGIEYDPSLSPDGTQIAFAHTASPNAYPHLYISLVDGGRPIQLTTGDASDGRPAWSPDARSIAFARFARGRCTVFIIPVGGGVEREVGSCGVAPPGGLAWSPDGKVLVTSAQDSSGPHRLVVLTLESTGRRTLTSPPLGSWGDWWPSFSPDGRTISFARTAGEGVLDLFVVDVATGEERRITSDRRSITGQTFASDGAHLIFGSDRDGMFGVWEISLDGGRPRLLISSTRPLNGVSAARSSERVVFSQPQSEIAIWQAPLTAGPAPIAGRAKRMIAATGRNVRPRFSPDGARLVFESSRSGRYEIWLSDASGANQRPLTTLGSPFASSASWSPDGRSVAFDARVDSSADLHVIDMETSRVRRLTDGAGDELAPAWSPDARSIFFESNRSGEWEIWKVAGTGGSWTRVTRGGGSVPMISPDGSSLYFARGAELWRMPAAGGNATALGVPIRGAARDAWVPTNDGVFFVRATPKGAVVSFRDGKSGRVSDVLVDPAIAAGTGGLAISPDGRRLLYARVDRLESDLTLLEPRPPLPLSRSRDPSARTAR
jgi:Tol biopolymer transport system component/DNA-binding winged helix-turn-helix (wHTH) protein